ncbi:MAG: CotH kinase family protein, partial [Bacteroidota bacterium]
MKLYILFLLITVSAVFSQRDDDSWMLYEDSEVAKIHIQIAQEELDWVYAHESSDIYKICTVHFKNSLIDETIDSVGFRLRGNTSRQAKKKSFKLSFDDFVKGREFFDVEKLNLNGEHNDPSIIRSKLCWDLFRDIGITVSRASFAAVYINGNYYGLYISVEHVDEEFLKRNFADPSGSLWKCLYPADLVYKGSNPDLYKIVQNGRRTYDLKSNTEFDDYSKFAQLVDVINNTDDASYHEELPEILNIEETLSYFAMNVLTASWDDYWFLKNNYYVYHETDQDIFHWIPFDYDNSFGIDFGFKSDWSTVNPYKYGTIDGTPRPLIEKILKNNELRNLYTHFITFYNDSVFYLKHWEQRLDSLKLLITPFAIADTFRTMDYGFSIGDFFASFESTSFSKRPAQKSIKEFVKSRNQSLGSQTSYRTSAPIVYHFDWSPRTPGSNDSVLVETAFFHPSGIKSAKVILYDSAWDEIGNIDLKYSPRNSKKVRDNDRWIASLPPFSSLKYARIKVRVVSSDDKTADYPALGTEIKFVTHQPGRLVINEIMAKNDAVNTDESGEYDDWIEIYNSSTAEINIANYYLTDSKNNLTKWKFPASDLLLNPDEYLLIWCDGEDSFDLHTNFSLNADGEFIALLKPDGVTIVDSITFPAVESDISFGRNIDNGSWIFMNPTPSAQNVNIVGVDNNFEKPIDYKISAYPNPFNLSTTIRFTLPTVINSGNHKVKLIIYDALGREIETLVNSKLKSGSHEIMFNAEYLSSGLY